MKLDWKSKTLIGKGGNASVYKIADSKGNYFAIKISKSTRNDKAFQRFIDEVKILENLNGNDGIVPILHKNIPEKVSKKNRAYFVMPLCGKVSSNVSTYNSFNNFYTLVIKLARTLVDLHNNNIAHRDIKPENLLFYKGNFVFSDFGLAHFPKKEKISGEKEKIGAKWTIAPEMERISSTSEFKKADIYSFAKTLYILITNQSNAFEGQYIPKSSISLDNYIPLKSFDTLNRYDESCYDSIVLLEKLLIASTDNNPEKRPDAYQFAERLSDWFNSSFHERNSHDWEDCLSRIFPLSIPENSTWSKISEIISIIKLLSKEYNFLNYTFCPDYGGIDLTNVDYFQNKEFLILNDYYLIKPKRLRFESMDDLDFSYFQLELDTLESLTEQGSEKEFLYIDKKNKNLTDIENGNKPILRYLKGSFIITRKTSLLNQVRGNFDGHLGIHKNSSAEEYRNLVARIKRILHSQTTAKSV
jgi:serine/threonine-protein kinase